MLPLSVIASLPIYEKIMYANKVKKIAAVHDLSGAGRVSLTVVIPILSATNAENQQIAKQTPSFAPKNVKSGVFVLFKIIQPLHNKRVAILKESDEKRLIFIYPFTLIFQDFTSS